jgi:2-dehydropantoate 2-reductase
MDAVHVIGAGGIGCAVGYALCAAGVPVTFVDADPAKVAWGRAHGVAVDRLPPRSARFVPFADWEPPAGAPILLCTKCYDNAAVLDRLPDSTPLVPIQNGFDPLLWARPHALEGIASFVSECLPGRTHTRITRRGRLHLGPRAAAEEADGARLWERAARLAGRLRRAPFRVEAVSDIRPYKYTKLMYNAAISPLAAAAGIDNGQLLWLPAARQLFFALLQENYAILHGAGLTLAKIPGVGVLPDAAGDLLLDGG